MIEEIGKHAGIEDLSFKDLGIRIFDSLEAERNHNFTLPAWVTEEVFDFLEKAQALFMKLNAGSKLAQRLRAGWPV